MWVKVEPKRTPTWDYKNNRVLVGIYFKLETDVGPNNSNLYHVEREDGSAVAVWGSTVLDSRFEDIKIGTKVKMQYLGDVKTPGGGKPYHNFEIWTDEKEQEEETGTTPDDGTGEIPPVTEKTF